MSTTVSWPISADWVGALLAEKYGLESPVSVFACGFDPDLRIIHILIEVDDKDVDTLMADPIDSFTEIRTGSGVN